MKKKHYNLFEECSECGKDIKNEYVEVKYSSGCIETLCIQCFCKREFRNIRYLKYCSKNKNNINNK